MATIATGTWFRGVSLLNCKTIKFFSFAKTDRTLGTDWNLGMIGAIGLVGMLAAPVVAPIAAAAAATAYMVKEAYQGDSKGKRVCIVLAVLTTSYKSIS